MIKKDVVVIGGGIIGGVITYQLARYDLDLLVLEKNPVLADETTKGNSGAIHGGFDPVPTKLEAKLNVLGNKLWRTQIFKHLTFPRVQVDSLILAFSEDEIEHLHMLYKRGLKNKVPKSFMKILTAEEVKKREPFISSKVQKALLCTSSWAIEPVKATLAFFGAAENNGAEIWRNSEVTDIVFDSNAKEFTIFINGEKKIIAKNIINAAGHYADSIAELAGLKDFTQKTRRGEYRILSKIESHKINSICFMVPTIHGKGVIVAPMLDGRVLVGPTAEENIPKEETRVITDEKMGLIAKIGNKIIPALDMSKTEIILAGSRPIDVETDDFVIRYAANNQNFINAAGMQSPAIASAPAIALEVEKLLKKNKTKLVPKENFDPNFKVMW